MKVFYGDNFLNKEKLEKEGIYAPIKIEYYKIINETKEENKVYAKYGIEVIKKQYEKDEIKTEEKQLKFLSNDEIKINEILDILHKNEVTPVCVEDVLKDFFHKTLANCGKVS